MFEEGERRSDSQSGWAFIAAYDGAAAVIDAVLELDPTERYTKTELSDVAGVPLKTLYLDGTLEELVTVGLLEKHGDEGEETVFSVDDGSPVFDAALAFDDAVRDQQSDA
ncbi:hypothetical protein [Haloarcula salina]|uniref:Uncharacterized protein n=1 Tax=Haloarcula salina TaxID=1429914 RepID=A0AA41G089_9EURY|nr:hypothetical protein [Haloarcula salina]MBV0902015.1 hypothetical protein [Haloarcula salina]